MYRVVPKTPSRALQALACAARMASSTSDHRAPAAGAQRKPKAPPPVSPSESPSTSPPSAVPQHPMELLSMVFHQHPSALRLHRELTIALAEGDSEQAADLASVLAATVRRVTESLQSPPQEQATAEAAEADPDTLPPPVTEDVQEALEKTRETLVASQQRANRDASVGSGEGTAPHRSASPLVAKEEPFWRDPESLCVTLLESTFEADVLDGDASPLSAAGLRTDAQERQEMQILDEYLTKEAERWKDQKQAVLKVVLDVTKNLHLTPEEIHVHESTHAVRPVTKDGRHLNVLRHANLLIRGEVPALAAAAKNEVSGTALSSTIAQASQAELTVLKERMAQQGSALTPAEEEMALYELVMSKSTMRYLVGLHHDLEAAINASHGVRKAWEAADPSVRDRLTTPAAFFVSSVMEKLHPTLPLTDVLGDAAAQAHSAVEAEGGIAPELTRAIATPVLPFTFMLKACLWFTTDGVRNSSP